MNVISKRIPRKLVGLLLTLAMITAACSTGQASATEEADDDATSTTATVVTTTDDDSPTTTLEEEQGKEGEKEGDEGDEAEDTNTATTTAGEPQADFYDLVTVNGAQLAYSCIGEGSPKMVIEHGLATLPSQAEPVEHWYGWIGPQLSIAEFTEVCVYGRRGVVGSDPVPEDTVRTVNDQVADLVGFLDAMSFDDPVIVAGHSWGGAIAQVFADQYPERTAALVLIDSVSADYLDGFPFPSSGPIEFVDIIDGSEQLAAIDDLGDLPITVLSAGSPAFTVLGTPDGVVPAGAPMHDPASFATWTSQQADLAELSSDMVHTTLDDSGHLMHIDRPDAIVDAVAEIMERIDD